MAGYSRQSVADIIANAVIKAAPVNAEFNAIRDAFAFSGGHKHDGSSTEGAYIPLIADVDANNKVVVDTSNNRISFYVEVGGTAVEQLRIQDGAVVPVTDDDVDLGAVGAEFKDLYVDGIGYIDTIQIHENATITGNLTVNGNTTIGNSATDTVTFNADVASNLIPDADSTRTLGDATNYWSHGYIDAVTTTGNATVGGNLSVTGTTALTGTATITTADINSGAMDNVTIGASTPAAGTFTNLTSTGTSTHATVDINGGAIDGTTIGSSTPAAITGTTITSTGLGTFPSVNIDGGAIDGTTIGATSAAAGSFTTVTTSGAATLASADINGGTIDGAVIGGASAAAITGTTITGTSLVGPLTGAVTGNVTGNLTGNVTGNVTGDLTGNVTAASGSSTFNNVTINGGLDMNAGTTATITNLTDPTNAQDAATKGYVDTSIANVIDSAPAALDTLNELAAALGDDANFSTTVTNSIATKLPLAGGTMTGAIAMSTNKITGLGDPTANQDAATKAYVDTGDAAQLSLTGGTMTGAIDMGANKITTTYTPTDAADLTTKTYVDGILGSATSAAASAAAAATSESNAATSETNAANSASAAATSEANAAASYDSFDDRYLGAKASAPTLDNDGDALIIGALYFNTIANLMYVYSASGWVPAGSSVNGTSDRVTYTATSGQTVFAATYDTGYVDVYLNGVKLVAGTDFTATNGTSITLATGATTGDIVDIVAYGTFVLADHYTEAQSDARFVNVTGDTMTGNLDVQGSVTADGLTVDGITTLGGTGDNYPLVITSTDQYAGIQFQDGVTTNPVRIFNSTNDLAIETADKIRLLVSSNGDVSFREDTGTTAKFFWDASAESLGIGTTALTGNLDVVGSGNVSSVIRSTNANESVLRIQNLDTGTGANNGIYLGRTGSGNNYLWTYENEPWIFGTNNTERLRIDSSGNVGIGTTSPLSVLDVVASANAFQRIRTTSVSHAAVTLYQNGDTGTGNTDGLYVGLDGDEIAYVWNYEPKPLVFATSSTERMRIDSSGNLLIGQTDSNARLASTSTTNKQLSLRYTGVASYYTSVDSSGNYIIDKDGAERMRIDSSGNLLVGKTSDTFGTEGIALTASGSHITRSGGNALLLNRLSTDGSIIALYKDGGSVGVIGTTGGGMYLGDGDTGLEIDGADDAILPINSSTRASRDAGINLGRSDIRFKDLYLSGSISDGTNSATVADIVSGGGGAKAYVFYDMRSTLSIGESFNVSSVSDQGTGRGRISFTSNFSNGTYVASGSGGRQGNTTDCWIRVKDETFNPTASQIEMVANGNNGSEYDIQTNGGSFHGDLA